MTQIVGFAAKKQGGKNTSCNFIVMLKLLESYRCKDARVDNNGEIEVTDIDGETILGKDYFPFKYVDVDSFLNDWNEVRIYALADNLKRIAIDLFGVDKDKVYGTDKDKATKTNIYWENMPGVTTNMRLYNKVKGWEIEHTQSTHNHLNLIHHKAGVMTIRELLQYMGTEIFRRMYDSIWVDSLLKRIENDNPKLALICDVRFENEMQLLTKVGALNIGLSRDIFQSSDAHASEQINFDFCHMTIDNSKLSIAEQNKAIYFALKELGCKNLR